MTDHVPSAVPAIVSTTSRDPTNSRSGWSSANVATGRWNLGVLKALEYGPLRRSALRVRVRSVSGQVLTGTPRRTEDNQLLSRTTVATVPVEVDYALTPRARSLWPALIEMHRWAERSQELAIDPVIVVVTPAVDVEEEP